MIGRLVNTARVLAELPRQRALPWWPRERLDAERDRNVRRAVRHAAATVPYYRALFQPGGLDPREVRGASDLCRLPLLDKRTVQAEPLRLVTQAGQPAVEFITSGSTGTPLRVRHDIHSMVMNLAYTEPEKAVVRGFFAGRRYTQASFLYGSSTVTKIQQVCGEHTFLPMRTRLHVLDVGTPLEENIAAVNRLRPDVLSGYGSYLELLFRHLQATGSAMHLPRVVIYGADMMSVDGRLLIEDTFGCSVLSRYNCVESFRIGFTCEAGQGFHLRDDLCLLRTVDANGRDLPPGVPGEIILSNLVNRGTVLLNYRVGDLGVTTDEPCPCGRTLRRLVELHGRVEDSLKLADGRTVHPRSVWSLLKGRDEVLRYQLVQRAADEFELRLATRTREDYARLSPVIEAELAALLGAVHIDLSYCADPQRLGAAGKFRAVVSCPAPAADSTGP